MGPLISCSILSFRPLPPPARSLCGEIRKSVGLWGCDSFPEPAFIALDVSDSSRLVQVNLRSASSPSCTCLMAFMLTFCMYFIVIKCLQWRQWGDFCGFWQQDGTSWCLLCLSSMSSFSHSKRACYIICSCKNNTSFGFSFCLVTKDKEVTYL